VKDNHSPTFFLIALAVFCWWVFLEKKKDKKSSLKFQV
jgi:hypothetical protein